MKHAEREPQQKKAPLPEPIRKVFTEAERKHPHDFAKQAELIVSAHRPAGLPESAQPLLMAGDPNSFREFIRRDQRIEQEAKERQKQDQQKRERDRRAEEARLEQKKK